MIEINVRGSVFLCLSDEERHDFVLEEREGEKYALGM